MTLYRKTFQILTLAAVLMLAPAAFAQEQFTVPLSDPSKPAKVKASLIMGSILVEGYDGQEVMVETSSEMEEIEKDEGGRGGLRRIPNTSSGMTVEEHRNEVRISVESWNKAVNLKIRVPRRTALKLGTVNDGDIVVNGVEGELELGNTNGSIEAIGISGSVIAQTVNGEVKVTFDAVSPGKAMSFTNMNGDIDVTFPAGLAADLRMRSDMGDILTDFDFEAAPATVKTQEGEAGKGFKMKIEKEIRAKVGGGGPEMVFKNFNGDIIIRKGK